MILLRPVDLKFSVSQPYGENPHLYEATHGHNGIDYSLPEGNPVRAAAAGVVERSELDTATASDPRVGYGYHVRILHPDGARTIYAHLQEGGLLVITGQNVRMGDVIGRSGNTGRSTGPHLHFELRLGPSVTSGIDPSGLMVDEIPTEAALFTAAITPDGDGLRIRVGPGTKYHIVRSLRSGDQVQVYGVAGDRVWLRVQEGYIMYKPEWVKIEQEQEGQ